MKIRIIGVGKMGGAIAKQLGKKHQISLYDKFPEKVEGIISNTPFENVDS